MQTPGSLARSPGPFPAGASPTARWLSAAFTVVALLAAGIVLSGYLPHQVSLTVVAALAVGIPIAIGLYDHRRLTARVEESLAELRASRGRILSAADDERRRIERDLHDGGQQHLVALRIKLELADEMIAREPERARDMLHLLGDDVDAVIEELRGLAAGVYPSMLEDRGLTAALRSAALRSPVPARVSVAGIDRYPDEIETAAYFCCLEALQNVAKHAPEATAVQIALHRNGDLRFEVQDNGQGFVTDDRNPGQGLMNMRDRVAAVGGELQVRSSPGSGTSVVGRIPVSAA